MRTKFKDIKNDVTEAEFKTFVGDNAYKFSQARERVLNGKHTAHSWWALLFGVFYSVYYKHWDVFVAFILLAMIFAVSGGDGNQSSAIGASGLFVSIYCHYRFKHDYVKAAYQKIYKLKQVESDEERLRALLQKKGGTSWLNVIIAIVLISLATGFLGTPQEREEFAQAMEEVQQEMQAIQDEIDGDSVQKNIFDDADSIFDE